MNSHGDQANSSGDVRVDPSPLTLREQESSYSRGHSPCPSIIDHVALVDLFHSFDLYEYLAFTCQLLLYSFAIVLVFLGLIVDDGIKSNIVEDSQSLMLPFSTPVEMAHSVVENNQALTSHDMQEIVDMMKLDGSESSLLAMAIKTHPQLWLSTNDRSTWMLCNSYRVLLNILNILTTRTPFTIAEADKRMLAENLKDAHVLGFDKDWLDSIKTKVFCCDTYNVDHIQEVLKGLEDELKTNEAMLATICEQEVEAAQVVEVAQQKHANVIERHTELLKARQDILARWHQYWEIIASKNSHFGF